jgi:ubiquinone/menaquinone biosynthesis C-methylase UbiE
VSTNESRTVQVRRRLGRAKRATARGLRIAADRLERVGRRPVPAPAPEPAVARQPMAEPVPTGSHDAVVRGIGEVWDGHPYYEEVEKWTDHMWDAFAQYREGADYRSTLELAVGHGRHSEKLLPLVDHITLVDINESNIEFCRERFGDDPRITYLVNDGDTLSEVPDGSITFVYCVDAMVHFDSDSVRSYLAEFNRILVPGGRGFCHHSNYTGNPGGDWLKNPHWRNFMSRELFAHYASKSGLRVLQSDLTDWGTDTMLDCYTTFEKPA